MESLGRHSASFLSGAKYRVNAVDEYPHCILLDNRSSVSRCSPKLLLVQCKLPYTWTKLRADGSDAVHRMLCTSVQHKKPSCLVLLLTPSRPQLQAGPCSRLQSVRQHGQRPMCGLRRQTGGTAREDGRKCAATFVTIGGLPRHAGRQCRGQRCSNLLVALIALD